MVRQPSERRCLLTGDATPRTGMVRLVMSPEDCLVPDVAAKLPGRGVWVSADGPALRQAVKNGKLAAAASRSLKRKVARSAVAADLVDQTLMLIERRALNRLGLLNRAGAVCLGYDQAAAALQGDAPVALVLVASDAADGSVAKIERLAQGRAPVEQPFNRDQMSRALGHGNAVHVVVLASGGTQELTADLSRLEGLRAASP